MRISSRQQRELGMLVAPIVKWLNTNTHPHCTIVITTDSVEVTETLTKLYEADIPQEKEDFGGHELYDPNS